MELLWQKERIPHLRRLEGKINTDVKEIGHRDLGGFMPEVLIFIMKNTNKLLRTTY